MEARVQFLHFPALLNAAHPCTMENKGAAVSWSAAHLHLQCNAPVLFASHQDWTLVCPKPSGVQAHLAQLSLSDIFEALEVHQDQADLQAKGLVALGVLGQVRRCASITHVPVYLAIYNGKYYLHPG